jgi:hypothetical protein
MALLLIDQNNNAYNCGIAYYDCRFWRLDEDGRARNLGE